MQNNFWSQVPFLRLLPAVLAGILTAIYENIIPLEIAWLVSIMLIVTLSILIIFKKYFSSYRLRWVTGIHFYFLSFLFFYILTLENTSRFDQHHFQNKLTNAEEFIGQLTEEPIEKAKSRKTEIKIIAIKNDENWTSCSGKILAYINHDSLSKNLSYGDLIAFSAIPSPTQSPQNPFQFNYKNFLRFQQIEYQVYLANEKWNPLNINSGNVIIRYAVNSRKRLLDIYRKNNIKGQEFAVLSALTLGYKDEIDAETQRAFSASGAMHVLAVSGLHVGIIFLALQKLLFFLERGRRKKAIQLLIIASVIWAFAIISGLSPSVIRASAMVSLIVLGKLLLRHTNIFNVIAASAIVLLAVNPFMIMEVGFQLSYLAVTGIVALQPWIYKLIYVPNRILDWLWQLTSVSIAAQLCTFPLGLLYYQQFPNFFLFSNLIVIPLASIIICVAILLLAFSSFSLLAGVIATALNYLTLFLNHIVSYIEKLPYSFATGISISIIQTWMIYLIITTMCFFIVRKNRIWLRLCFLLSILFLSLLLIDSIKISKQKQFVVYDVNGMTAVQFTHSRNSLLLADQKLLDNKSSMQFNINRNIYALGIASMQTISLEEAENFKKISIPGIFFKNNFISFNGEKYFIAGDSFQNYSKSEYKVRLDAVIVTGKSVKNIISLINNFVFSKLIISSSVPVWMKNKLQQQCKEHHISCYAVSEKGAFVSEN